MKSIVFPISLYLSVIVFVLALVAILQQSDILWQELYKSLAIFAVLNILRIIGQEKA